MKRDFFITEKSMLHKDSQSSKEHKECNPSFESHLLGDPLTYLFPFT